MNMRGSREMLVVRRGRRPRLRWWRLGAALAATLLLPGLTGGASQVAPASGGDITGTVVDGSGVQVPGVTVTAVKTGRERPAGATFTDRDGRFSLENLPPGRYTVTAALPGFEPAAAKVLVLGEEIATVRFKLVPMAFSGTVEVEAKAPGHSAADLLDTRRQAPVVTDAISSEEISRSADSDAAEVVTRLTGVSIGKGKYVYVRGLGERYSHVTLNGAKISTTEPEKRVVPLDLFPSEMLQTVEVSKTYTPDREGEFGGGDLDLTTLDFPEEMRLSVSLGMGLNDTTTGEAFGQYGSGLSWRGGGGQAMPSKVPPDRLIRKSFVNPQGLTPEELQAIGRSFGPTWQPSVESSAPFDGKASFNFGTTYAGKIGLMLSGVMSHEYRSIGDEIQSFYGLDEGNLVPRNDYRLVTDTESVRNGLLGSFGYHFNRDHKITLTSFFIRNAETMSRFQEGYNSNDGNNIRDIRLHYKKEDIFINRLAGVDSFPDIGAGSELRWEAAHTKSSRDFDLRENLYHEIDPGLYWLNVGAPESGKIEYHSLDESLTDIKTSWSTFFTHGDRSYGSIQAGLAYSNRSRGFLARRFRFVARNPSQFDLSLPPEELFTPDNIRPDGWEIREQTGFNDAYTGSHTIGGLFGMADWTFGRWRVIGGLRVESSDQGVVTTNPFDTSRPVTSRLENTDYLPAVNVVYAVNDATNLRMAVSRTLNRPDFRELSPFFFQDVTGGWGTAGNPDLTEARLNSFDFRLETFPASGEVMAVSAFYKKIEDPIERIIVPTTEYLVSFVNADTATLYGAELEFRRHLEMLWSGLKYLNLNLNYTYTHSNVTIPPDKLSAITSTNRPLEGQAKHVGNASLELVRPDWGTSIKVVFNYTGRRIANVGAFGLPDIYQSAMRGLDLTYAQSLDSLLRGLSLKLAGSNLLDEKYEHVQGGEIQQQYTVGRSYSLAIAYSWSGR